MRLIGMILFSAIAAVFLAIAFNGSLFNDIFVAITAENYSMGVGEAFRHYLFNGNQLAAFLIQTIASFGFIFFTLVGMSVARARRK